MEVPGMNPLQNRMAIPNQVQPAGPQSQVPDLILDAPQTRTPTGPQAQPATTMPYEAPAQAMVQQVYQDMTAALMEMGLPATQQNQQMASLLAGYGNAVNSQTLGILRQAMQPLADKSPAAMEAAVILLTQDLPVTDKSVAAIKQFLNGQALPEQLQNLPKELGSTLQQMQQAAQTPLTTTPAQTTAQTATQNLAQTAAQTAAQDQPQTAGQPVRANPAPAQVAGQPANPAAAGSLPGQPGVPVATPQQQVAQQVALHIQSGQTLVEAAPLAANLQQAVGQAQSAEHRIDTSLSQRSTAEKIAAPEQTAENLPAIEEVDGQQGQASQSNQVSQHLPSARSQDQDALHQLYLHLQGGEVETLPRVGPGAGAVRSPEEAVLRLLTVMQELGQIAGHLAENMQLRDFSHLPIQHQQILQLTGLLEQRLQEFHQLFASAFPELAQQVEHLVASEGQDLFGKLAQLIDENQRQLQAQLQLPADGRPHVLSTLSQLMQQAGVQIERIESQLVAREMLSQNLPIHVVPLTIHHQGERFPAELCVQQDYDPREQRPDGGHGRPFKLTLTLETKNLGRVSVDLAALKDDMTVDLKVQTRRIKTVVDDRLKELRTKVETGGDYKISHLGCRVVPDLESRQSMLLPPKRVIRSLRRVEGVV